LEELIIFEAVIEKIFTTVFKPMIFY
jgi:hypothetical protein